IPISTPAGPEFSVKIAARTASGRVTGPLSLCSPATTLWNECARENSSLGRLENGGQKKREWGVGAGPPKSRVYLRCPRSSLFCSVWIQSPGWLHDESAASPHVGHVICSAGWLDCSFSECAGNDNVGQRPACLSAASVS